MSGWSTCIFGKSSADLILPRPMQPPGKAALQPPQLVCDVVLLCLEMTFWSCWADSRNTSTNLHLILIYTPGTLSAEQTLFCIATSSPRDLPPEPHLTTHIHTQPHQTAKMDGDKADKVAQFSAITGANPSTVSGLNGAHDSRAPY